MNELGQETAAPEPFGLGMTFDARHPVLLNDRDQVLKVTAGHVDIFAVEAGKATGMRHRLFRVGAGEIILNLHAACEKLESSLQVVAIGNSGAEAIAVSRTELGSAEAISGWIRHLAELVSRSAPTDLREVIPGEKMQMGPGASWQSSIRGVLWTRVETGAAKLLNSGPACPAGSCIPLTPGLWLTAAEEGCTLLADEEGPTSLLLWEGLDTLHRAVIACLERRLQAEVVLEQERLEKRTELIRAQTLDSFERLSDVVSQRPDRARYELDPSDPLLASCRTLIAGLGATIVPSRRSRQPSDPLTDAFEIARAARVRARRVKLRDGWWKLDAGPLLAWYGTKREPVALVRDRNDQYAILDRSQGRKRRVHQLIATDMAPEAVSFYKVFPASPLRYRDLLAFSMGGLTGTLARIVFAALLIGILSLLPPVLTNVLVSSVIPRTEFDQLIVCAAALSVTAVALAGMQGVQGLVTLRLEGLLDYKLQAALIDRLLRLPASLFRNYTTGDLVDRSLGIEAVRQILTGRVLRGFTAGLFGLFSIGLMLYYDRELGSLALMLIAVRAIVILAASAVQVYFQTKHFELRGTINGFVLQLIAGVGKLRVAHATGRALAQWARHFALQKKCFMASQRTANVVSVFESSFPILATLCVFALASYMGSQLLTNLGAFLGFLAAFGQAIAAVGNWASSVSESLATIPHLKRLKPIIATAAEADEDRRSPGQLSGDIELSGVVFRYRDGGPKVLDDLTLRIAPGEYVALVGPSGSGKSSLLRLLLGFERPEAGSIFYDGKALNTLDMGSVRRQLGVVLQDTKLATGSLYDNICGGLQLSPDRAWDAARSAALDADIKEMPMGMNTVVAEGINTLSGGQRQRVLIARAIARSPRILLFDEATSALDNQTQAMICASLERLSITRIVIAHRLSTIRSADRIIMLAGGKIIQSGTFKALMESNGPFAEFARRQIVE